MSGFLKNKTFLAAVFLVLIVAGLIVRGVNKNPSNPAYPQSPSPAFSSTPESSSPSVSPSGEVFLGGDLITPDGDVPVWDEAAEISAIERANLVVAWLFSDPEDAGLWAEAGQDLLTFAGGRLFLTVGPSSIPALNPINPVLLDSPSPYVARVKFNSESGDIELLMLRADAQDSWRLETIIGLDFVTPDFVVN